MPSAADRLRADALAVWQAGVEAVRADRLVRDSLRIDGDDLVVGTQRWPLKSIRQIVVVGAGKAGAGMAAGLEEALGAALAAEKNLTGWINVPADCVRPLQWLTLHAARPAGVNEPAAEGVAGTQRILELVAHAHPDDLCLCLVSGGGSALLPAPVPGVSLDDKQQVTRALSGLGANIQQLNTVRKQLSRIKGGRLAQACRANRLVSLIISDVLGDPLDVIASGPTVPDSSTPQDALAVLSTLGAGPREIPESVIAYLQRSAATTSNRGPTVVGRPDQNVVNLVIGNNAVAVEGAAREARRRGYTTVAEPATRLEGAAEDVGRSLAERALSLAQQPAPHCLITGGEPTVRLAPTERRGKGGRNQQLILAAFDELQRRSATNIRACDRIVLLSGGTDGEDGPTDAAGALIDALLCERWAHRRPDVAEHLARNDAYHFFQPLGGLIVTGPTHTNVCDVRVVVTAGLA